jgi:hypothetical protein
MSILAFAAAAFAHVDSSVASQLAVALPPGTTACLAAGRFGGTAEPLWLLGTDAGAAVARLDQAGWQVLDRLDLPGADLGDVSVLDLDGDGRDGLWLVVGGELVELALDAQGHLVRAQALALPGAFGGFVDQALFRLGLPTGVELLVRLAPSSTGTRLDAVWSGRARGALTLAGGATFVLDAHGAAWCVRADAVEPCFPERRFTALLASPADAPFDGPSAAPLRLVADESGALLRLEEHAVVESGEARLRLALVPLVVEGGPLDLAAARLLDLDGDGDRELVALDERGFSLRDGWGASGFLAPRRIGHGPVPLVGADFELVRVDGRPCAIVAAGIVPLDVRAEHSALAHVADGAHLSSLDLDRDGDLDLLAAGALLVNDGAGGFTEREFAPNATSSVALELAGAHTLLVAAPDGLVALDVRTDGSFAAPRALAAERNPTDLEQRLVGDLDGDGRDEFVADGSVFAVRADALVPLASHPGTALALVDADADGRAELLVHDPLLGVARLLVWRDGAFVDGAHLSVRSERVDAVASGRLGGAPVIALATGEGVALCDLAVGLGTLRSFAVLPFDGVQSLALVEHGGALAVACTAFDGRLALLGPDGELLALRHGFAGGTWCDLDGDLDLDLVAVSDGLVCLRGRLHDGDLAGGSVQYGLGSPGSGGLVPLLGVRGPVRASAAPGELRLLAGPGDAQVFLAVTPDEWVLDLRRFGLSVEQSPQSLAWIDARLDGRAGVAGVGSWRFPLEFAPGLVGRTLRGQAFVVDPAAVDGVSASNRVLVTFGL